MLLFKVDQRAGMKYEKVIVAECNSNEPAS